MLTIMFIALKLSGSLNWPWFWVLWPLWLQFSLVALAGCAALALRAVERGVLSLVDRSRQ